MLSLNKFIKTIDQLEDAWVLLAALKFRLFTLLAKKSLTVRQVARLSKTQCEGMEALLNSLVAMQALRYKAGKYSNTSEMHKYFCATSPHYLKGTAFLKLEKNDEWTQLINTIKQGRDLSAFEGGDDKNFRYLFTHAMHERSVDYASTIAKKISSKPVGRFLDLGGGPGSYSAAILQEDKKSEATLLDRPAAIKVAKELFHKRSFFKRFHFLPGDLFDSAYGKDYDMVFFSNILHIYNLEENKKLFQKINRALVPGGSFILVDYFLKEDRTGPYEGALFSLTMLLFTKTGKTYTYGETEKILRQTGFHKIKRTQLAEGNGMLEAFKK
ncbi:MAG: methyltransferase [Nitrospina sp.]|nr:MAG: methyltransferase [Nitrospina sp.]